MKGSVIALDTIADVDASGLWPGKVVTEVEPAGDFWEAEPEHQDYLERFPNGYTCHFPRPGWVLPKRDVTSPIVTSILLMLASTSAAYTASNLLLLFALVMFDVLPQFLPPHLVQHLAFAIVDHFVRERDLLGVSAR